MRTIISEKRLRAMLEQMLQESKYAPPIQTQFKFISLGDENKSVLVVLHDSHYTTMLDRLNSADESSETGYGQYFEKIVEDICNLGAISSLKSPNFIDMNSEGNMPFADLLNTGGSYGNELYTLKFSRTAGIGKLSGIKYSQIPQALKTAKNNYSALSTFQPGLIKGDLDYSYIDTIGYLGLPINITFIVPDNTTPTFKITGKKGAGYSYVIQKIPTGNYNSGKKTIPRGSLVNDLASYLNLVPKTDNTGKQYLEAVSGLETTGVKESELTSVKTFKEKLMLGTGSQSTTKVLLLSSDFTSIEEFETELARMQRQRDNQPSPLYRMSANNVKQYMTTALVSQVTPDVKANNPNQEAEAATYAASEIINYLLTEAEICSNSFDIGNGRYQRKHIIRPHGDNSITVAYAEGDSTTITGFNDSTSGKLKSLGKKADLQVRSGQYAGARKRTFIHYAELYKSKVLNAIVVGRPGGINVNELSEAQQSLLAIAHRAFTNLSESIYYGDLDIIKANTIRYEKALKACKGASVPTSLLPRYQNVRVRDTRVDLDERLSLGKLIDNSTSIDKIDYTYEEDEDAKIFLAYVESLNLFYDLYQEIFNSTSFEEIIEKIKIVIPILDADNIFSDFYNAEAQQSVDISNTDSRLYNNVLQDIMEAAKKKRKSVKRK